MQFLVIGRFCIPLDEIACIYVDDIDVNIVLKHTIYGQMNGTAPNARYIIDFKQSTPEAKKLLAWAKRHGITLDD